MSSGPSTAIPITIITGFLGAGKTTLILRLIPQLPSSYRLALVKNEFGDVAVDSQLATTTAISGVRELLNGCICCNLVGALGEALTTLRTTVQPDRIILETSGSAFPATLALEINRLARETGHYVLDGVVAVIDVENWKGYEDTSYTARMQARFTDLVVLNKWELAGEQRLDECLDRLGDLDVPVATVRSQHGTVPANVLLGLDSALARTMAEDSPEAIKALQTSANGHAEVHTSEVEVLSVKMNQHDLEEGSTAVKIPSLLSFLQSAPKDEIYRIKGLVRCAGQPASSDETPASSNEAETESQWYILNWAFGRWTFTAMQGAAQMPDDRSCLRLTVITARYEANKWMKRLQASNYFQTEPSSCPMQISRIS